LRFFFRHKILLVAVAVILLSVIMSVVSALTGGYASPVSNALGSLFRPLQSAVVGLADQASSLYGYMYQYDNLEAENEELRQQIAHMEEEVRQSTAANEENARLRELLGLSARRRDLNWESATITARNVSNWASTFTLSRGSNYGFKPRDCVITSEGFLVGFISEVGQNWATVTTLIDSDMEAGAYNARTNQAAVAEGSFDLMRGGALRLSYLAKDDDVKNGDPILTSGIGGLFPRDLVIGTVMDMRTDETGISAYAIITPSVKLEELTQVFVVTSFDISE
jgi:rod shape-determining protein MreC